MSAPVTYRATVNEDGTAYVLARILRKDSNHAMSVPATSDFSSITRGVYLTRTSTAVLAATTLTTTNVVLSSLSTGNIWTADSTGFNFIDTVPSSGFPDGGEVYTLEYKFTLASGEVGWMTIHATAMNMLGS